MSKKHFVQILVDNDSWIIPYAQKLTEDINNNLPDKSRATFIQKHSDIEDGEILFLLGCTKILKTEYLAKNAHNLVVHESALPKGKGFAPLFWQILEGKNIIPISLFEATESVDEGDIYLQSDIVLEGHELNRDIRHVQGEKTIEMCLEFLEQYPNIKGQRQVGEESFHKKRTLKDSELDISKSIDEQFNLLRIVDNQNYPAFFYKSGYKYILKIEEDKNYDP